MRRLLKAPLQGPSQPSSESMFDDDEFISSSPTFLVDYSQLFFSNFAEHSGCNSCSDFRATISLWGSKSHYVRLPLCSACIDSRIRLLASVRSSKPHIHTHISIHISITQTHQLFVLRDLKKSRATVVVQTIQAFS